MVHIVSAWVFLLFAGLTEVAWVVALKHSDGFNKLIPSLICAAFVMLGMYSQGQALKSIPMGTAYAVWTGIGSAGTLLVGMHFYEESRSIFRILFIIMIVTGIIGLKLTSDD